MKKILSLDIGISSIGNAVVELDDENFYGKILDAGVRIFSAAEQPSGDSLAAPRREARGARRRISRRSSRLYNIKKYLILNNFITQEQIENLYCSNKQIKDVWTLRKEALYRKLNNEEFYRCGEGREEIKMIKEAIVKLSKKEDLTFAEAREVMNEIMDGQASGVQMEALSVEDARALLEETYVPLDTLVNRVYRENISLALFDVGGIGTIRYVPASGTIRFSLPEGAESNEDAGYWFEANITLRAEGNEPIDFRGYMYAYW